MPRRSRASRRVDFYEERFNSPKGMETTLDEDILAEAGEHPSDDTIPSGIVPELGGCPLGILRQTLQMTSLYDRCCWGGTNSKMRDAVISMTIGIPVTPKLIEIDPSQILTPYFQEVISLLLQFHLPAACPHARIFLHVDSNGISFLCQKCGGSIKFKLAVIKALSQVAFCTTIKNQNTLRLRCLKLINEMEKPVVVGTNSSFNPKQGYTCEVILKKERQVENKSQPSEIAGNDTTSKVGSKCTCTISPDPSGDESQCEARLGRRKGRRRGVRPSRMMMYLNDDCCPRCRNANSS